MHRLLSQSFLQPFSRLSVSISGFLVTLCLICFCFADSASAADRVFLVYETARTTVDYDELQAFANGEDPSENLQVFFQDVPLSMEQQRFLLTDPILPSISLDLGSDLTEFAAIQVRRVMGDPLDRESFDSLEIMLNQALIDDRSFTMLELVETYPDPDVRLNLDRLSQVQSEISLFVERLHPLLQAVDVVLNDLFCACENQPGPARIADVPPPSLQPVSFHPAPDRVPLPCSINLTRSPFLLATLPLTMPFQPVPFQSVPFQSQIDRAKSKVDIADIYVITATEPLRLAQAGDFPIRTAEAVVITFGPLARSIPMSDLTALAETGTVSRRLRLLLGLAKINPDELRAVLNKSAQVNLAALDKQLNSPLGAFALYEVGKVIRTRSNKANIQALRSALVLSARDDNQITLIEFLQNYPGQQVYLEGAKLAKLAGLASNQNTLQEFAIDQVQTVEDFLVNFQASIAAEVCECDAVE